MHVIIQSLKFTFELEFQFAWLYSFQLPNKFDCGVKISRFETFFCSLMRQHAEVVY